MRDHLFKAYGWPEPFTLEPMGKSDFDENVMCMVYDALSKGVVRAEGAE